MPDIQAGFQQVGVATQVGLVEVGTDVVQPVDCAEFGDRGVDEILHGPLVGEIEFDCDGAAAGLADAIGGGGGAGDVDITDRYGGAFGGQAFGGGGADPGGSARDEECLALQPRIAYLEILSSGLERSSMP